MKTKEQILDEIVMDFSSLISFSDAYEAMEAYAQQQAVAFAIHYAEGLISHLHGILKMHDVKNDRMGVRYKMFIESKNNQS